MKTKAGAKKRFKLTGSGKIKRKHAFKSHILTKKNETLQCQETILFITPKLYFMGAKPTNILIFPVPQINKFTTGHRNAIIPGYQITKIPRYQGNRSSQYHHTMVPRYQNIKIPSRAKPSGLTGSFSPCPTPPKL